MKGGMTIKAYQRSQFWAALDHYKQALRERKGIVEASLRIHIALGGQGVPKSWKRYVNRAFKARGEG